LVTPTNKLNFLWPRKAHNQSMRSYTANSKNRTQPGRENSITELHERVVYTNTVGLRTIH